MLKTLKLIRSILVIVAISAISLYALYLGADATVVAAFSLPSLAAYAGAEAADYVALVQGFLEAKGGQSNGSEKAERQGGRSMPGKELTFENGEPRDANDCPHDGDVIEHPGANPVCADCGEIDPEVDDD